MAKGDYEAAAAGYTELRRVGALARSDAGNWLRAVRSLERARRRPSLSELVAAFPDDQDLLEFVAAELWQRAESRADSGDGDTEIAGRAWAAALRLAGPVPENDAAGVRLIGLLDRFYQAGRRQDTPIGSYSEYETALVRFAAAGPESTLTAADLLAPENPALAIELVAHSEASAEALLVRAVAAAELDDFALAVSLFDRLATEWGRDAASFDVADRSRLVQALTDVGRFAEAEVTCRATLAELDAGRADCPAGDFDHWRHVYHLLGHRLASQQGDYRRAWEQLRAAAAVPDAGQPAELRRSILRVRVLLADRDQAPELLAQLRQLASADPYDTAYPEACLWAGAQWGGPDGDPAPAGPLARARFEGQAAARSLLAAATPGFDSRQLIRLALLAGDDDLAGSLLRSEPLRPVEPWSVQVLVAMVALRQGDDATANRLLAEVVPTRRHDLDLRVLDAQASLISGDYKVALRETLAITDAVPQHILARAIQAESEFEAALAMAEEADDSHGSVENAQQLMAAVADYRGVADLQRHTLEHLQGGTGPGRPAGTQAPVGSEPLPPRLFAEACRRGLHAAILAQEALDRLGLRGDRQLVNDAQDLLQHLRAQARPCCRRWGARPARLLHQVRHLVDRDEPTRLALLMISYRWSAWRRRLQNLGFVALGALVTWAGLTNRLPGPESDTIRALVLGLGVLLLLMPFARSLKVGVVELSRDADAAPLSGRSKSLRTSRLLLRANHLGTFSLPAPPQRRRRTDAEADAAAPAGSD